MDKFDPPIRAGRRQGVMLRLFARPQNVGRGARSLEVCPNRFGMSAHPVDLAALSPVSQAFRHGSRRSGAFRGIGAAFRQEVRQIRQGACRARAGFRHKGVGACRLGRIARSIWGAWISENLRENLRENFREKLRENLCGSPQELQPESQSTPVLLAKMGNRPAARQAPRPNLLGLAAVRPRDGRMRQQKRPAPWEPAV